MTLYQLVIIIVQSNTKPKYFCVVKDDLGAGRWGNHYIKYIYFPHIFPSLCTRMNLKWKQKTLLKGWLAFQLYAFLLWLGLAIGYHTNFLPGWKFSLPHQPYLVGMKFIVLNITHILNSYFTIYNLQCYLNPYLILCIKTILLAHN